MIKEGREKTTKEERSVGVDGGIKLEARGIV